MPRTDVLGALLEGESERALLQEKTFAAEHRRKLAAKGHALPDGSYPIESAQDLANAAKLAQSGHGNAAAAKKLIAKRAKQLGVANPLS